MSTDEDFEANLTAVASHLRRHSQGGPTGCVLRARDHIARLAARVAELEAVVEAAKPFSTVVVHESIPDDCPYLLSTNAADLRKLNRAMAAVRKPTREAAEAAMVNK